MSALIYLVRIQLKNMFFNLFRRPSKLISYGILFAFVGFSVFTGGSSESVSLNADIRLLHGIYLAILTVLSVITLLTGVKSGSTFFGMPDVNLLFVSPINPKTILQYGLVKQMSSMLLMIVFLLFYSPMLANNFGLQITDTLLLAVGLGILLLLSQFLSMLLYNFCNGVPSRRTWVKALVYGVVAVLALAIGLMIVQDGNGFQSILPAVSSPLLEWLPVVGWTKGFIFSIIESDLTGVLIFGALTLGAMVLSLLFMMKSNPDYYEDVLQSTEVSYHAKQVLEEKKDTMGMPEFARKVKVKREGLGGGFGANTFFYKHMCEMRRRSRLGLMTTSTLLIAGISIAVAVFINMMAASEGDPVDGGTVFGIILGIQVYLLFFFSSTGDWVNELKKPYVFLVPASAFSKLMWACMTTLVKPLLDGFFAFLLVWLYLRVNVLYFIAAVIVYGSFGFLFTAGNVLFVRLFGQPAGKGLLTFLYFFAMAILILPGAAVAGLALFFLEVPVVVAGVILAVSNTAVCLGVFAACRNVLETAELR